MGSGPRLRTAPGSVADSERRVRMSISAEPSTSQAPSHGGSTADAPRRPSGNDAFSDTVSFRNLGRRLLGFALVGIVIAAIVLAVPGLGELRERVAHASLGWLFAGVPLETLSALSYVFIFKAVFCPRMGWRLSSQIGLSELGANSVLPISGASGLALGAWALSRGGMSTEQIGRKSVAFFFLTSLANVASVIGLASLYALGTLGYDPNPPLTYSSGLVALALVVLVLSLPFILRRRSRVAEAARARGRVARTFGFARASLTDGIPDMLLVLRRRGPAVVLGSFGTMAFDLAVLGVAFRAFGASPPVGVLALGYLLGQLGGNIPVPGGIGGLDGGLIGAFALYHQSLAAATAATLAYHAIDLWVPGLLGGAAFTLLRRTLRGVAQPAALCVPLGEEI